MAAAVDDHDWSLPEIAALLDLGRRAKQVSAQLKLYVPSQCHCPVESAETSTRAWNPVNLPVPPENVASPLAAARSSLTWPAAVLPDPASRTTSVSSEPPSAASA